MAIDIIILIQVILLISKMNDKRERQKNKKEGKKQL